MRWRFRSRLKSSLYQAATRVWPRVAAFWHLFVGVLPVKRALSKVAGVQKAEVSFEKREAVVAFDDAKSNIEAITKATANAGYPSTLKAEK